MKKKSILYLLILLISLLFNINEVEAANATFSVKPSRTNMVVGNTITVTVTLSSSADLGSWEYVLNYDSSKFTLVSSDVPTYWATNATSSGVKSVSYKYTFKAKSSGSATFNVKDTLVYGWDEAKMSTTNGSTSVKIITQAELEASYSRNNYLKSLSVDDVDLNPEFNKETLEYNIELENDVTSIKVNAIVEDSKSSLTGTGEIAVSEGVNKIEIVVTAENGNTRTYIINATVKELSPISAIVDGKTYSVIRKKDVIDPPSNYQETTVIIDGEEVLAYESEITSYTLVGLKDEDGKMGYFIYDSTNNSYTKYNEFRFNQLSLYLKEIPKSLIPDNYKKVTITIGEEEVIAYKLNDITRHALIYGLNLETGEESLYTYDSKENTVQRYYGDEVDKLNETISTYMLLIIILGIIIGLGLISLIIYIIVKFKNKRKRLA